MVPAAGRAPQAGPQELSHQAAGQEHRQQRGQHSSGHTCCSILLLPSSRSAAHCTAAHHLLYTASPVA